MKLIHTTIFILNFLFLNNLVIAQQSQYVGDQYSINKRYYELLEKGKEPPKSEEEKYLKEIPKDLSKELNKIKNIDKKSYFKLLKEAWNIDNYFTYAQQEYPFQLSSSELKSNLIKQEFRKNIETEIIIIRYNVSRENEKKELRIKLKTKLNELFEIKGIMKNEEIKFLESKLQKLKVLLKNRQKNKNEIVEKKVNEILHEKDEDKFKWN